MKSFYVFGLQRSGTNYLEQLLKTNFSLSRANNSTRNDPNWKHNVNVANIVKESSHPIFVIHKNPYMWIESICFRRSVDWTITQNDFPATERHPDDDYNVGKEKLNIVNLAKTYQKFYRNWVTRTTPEIKEKSFVIKYEDLLVTETRENILQSINEHFSYGRHDYNWKNIERVGMSPSWKPTDADMYLSQTPRNLSLKQIKIITQTLTPTLTSNLGYAIL